MKEIEIYCHNTHSKHTYPLGTSLLEISRDLNIQLKNTVCGAIVNNQVRELSFCLVKPKHIEFFDVSHTDGIRMYIRSLIFVMYSAIKEVFPHVSLRIRKGISSGYFCELAGFGRDITDPDLQVIKKEMQELIEKDIPFIKKGLLTQDAVEHLMKEGLDEKAQLFEQKRPPVFQPLFFK